MTPFRKVRRRRDLDDMLQINNILRVLAEAKHSLNKIMKSAMDLPAMLRVNNDNNIWTSAKSMAGIRGKTTQWRE
jgi:hypothetical protein